MGINPEILVRRGLAVEPVPAYVEGSEPKLYEFLAGDACEEGSGYGQVLPRVLAYNFSKFDIPEGETVYLVIDMFQRLVVSQGTGGLIRFSQLGRVAEPIVSSPYREVMPNFVPTDNRGDEIPKDKRDMNARYLLHLSSGLVRIHGKQYAPLRATFLGGEEYIDELGILKYRIRGELRTNREDRPQYLLARQVSKDSKWFARHADFSLKKNAAGKNVHLQDLRSDSPFQGEYVDGRECNFDIKPISHNAAFPEEWELTLSWTQAQIGWDIALAPNAADGECFVKGEQLCFAKRVAFTNIPTWTLRIDGEWLEKHIRQFYMSQVPPNFETWLTNTKNHPDTKDRWAEVLCGYITDLGANFEPKRELRLEEGKYRLAGYSYYELTVPDEYLEPLRGQAKTEGIYFRILDEIISFYDVTKMETDPLVKEYVRLYLAKGAGGTETGFPAFQKDSKNKDIEERICRLCEFAPSRGLFYKMDSDGIRYPIMVVPDTSEGYGLATATLHKAYDPITEQCTDVIEHPRRRIVRDKEYRLLIELEDECWRQCAKIEGFKPPDLGDPREVPKRIRYMTLDQTVQGQMPPLTFLMPGSYLDLVNGVIFLHRSYSSAFPQYPTYYPPMGFAGSSLMWNPGGLMKPGYIFLGFATYPDAPYGLFMLSGDIDIGTLFPIFKRDMLGWEPTCEEPFRPNLMTPHPCKMCTVYFTLPAGAVGRFKGKLPLPMKLPYGSELDLVGYGDETMNAQGLFFAGWSTTATFQSVTPRIVLTSTSIALYAVFYTAKIPYSKAQPCELRFVVGNGQYVKYVVNASSVIRLNDFDPANMSEQEDMTLLPSINKSYWKVVGWDYMAGHEKKIEIDENGEFSPSDRPFHLVVKRHTTLFPIWALRPPDDLMGLYDPRYWYNPFLNPNNPYDSDNPLSPYNQGNPYVVSNPSNPYHCDDPNYPYQCEC